MGEAIAKDYEQGLYLKTLLRERTLRIKESDSRIGPLNMAKLRSGEILDAWSRRYCRACVSNPQACGT